ncbi:MAG: Archease protein family [Acidobacteria bacterium]|nr:Archease protein family [Acidobacteriota bacterium]
MPRPRYRALPHTADVRLAVWGADRAELLRNAVVGAVRLALGRPPRRGAIRQVVVPGPAGSLDRQLVGAVNEALHQLYARRAAAVGLVLRAGRIVLELSPLPTGRLPELEIKAATFHALRPRRRGGRLSAVLTLDL